MLSKVQFVDKLLLLCKEFEKEGSTPVIATARAIEILKKENSEELALYQRMKLK